MADFVIKNEMVKLQDSIFKNNYYLNLYLNELSERCMSVESVQQMEYDDRTLVAVCHSFWAALPDTAAIHREPFSALCDLAEHIFDFPEE